MTVVTESHRHKHTHPLVPSVDRCPLPMDTLTSLYSSGNGRRAGGLGEIDPLSVDPHPVT